MSVETLEARGQELELAEEQDGNEHTSTGEPKLFRDLYGVIKGAPDLTLEDFEAVKIRMNWDKFKDI